MTRSATATRGSSELLVSRGHGPLRARTGGEALNRPAVVPTALRAPRRRLSGDSQKYAGLPWWCSGQESARQCRRHKRCGVSPWVGKIPWKREWQPPPIFLSAEFPWAEGHKESDMTEPLSSRKQLQGTLRMSLKPSERGDTDTEDGGGAWHVVGTQCE